MEFKNQLSGLLKRKGLSNSEAARVLDVKLRTLENWKSGVNKPTEMVQNVVVSKLESHNISFSYDYDDFIEEIQMDIDDDILKMDDVIQILRKDQKKIYQPIIDWYYSKDVMKDLIEDMSDEDIYAYSKDFDNLIEVKVSDVLEEMQRMNEVL